VFWVCFGVFVVSVSGVVWSGLVGAGLGLVWGWPIFLRKCDIFHLKM
jgi:hypothetical protein